MNVIIGLETNLDSDKNDKIHNFFEKLDEFLKPKKFSNYIDDIAIRITCVRPEFDFFFTSKKLRIIKANTRLKHGVEISYNNHIAMDIKYNYLELSQLEGEHFETHLKSKLVETFFTLDRFHKSIPDFNFDEFKNALTSFLA